MRPSSCVSLTSLRRPSSCSTRCIVVWSSWSSCHGPGSSTAVAVLRFQVPAGDAEASASVSGSSERVLPNSAHFSSARRSRARTTARSCSAAYLGWCCGRAASSRRSRASGSMSATAALSTRAARRAASCCAAASVDVPAPAIATTTASPFKLGVRWRLGCMPTCNWGVYHLSLQRRRSATSPSSRSSRCCSRPSSRASTKTRTAPSRRRTRQPEQGAREQAEGGEDRRLSTALFLGRT